MFNNNNYGSWLLHLQQGREYEAKQERKCPTCDSSEYTQGLVPTKQYSSPMSCYINPLQPQRTCKKCGVTWSVGYDKPSNIDYDKIVAKKKRNRKGKKK